MGAKLLQLLPALPLPLAVAALVLVGLLVMLYVGLGRKGLRLRVALYPEPSLQLVNVRLPPWLLRRLNRGLRGGLPLQVERLRFLELRLAPAAWTEAKWRLEVCGLDVVARMTHVEEWDEAAMLQAAAALKRAEADMASALIEGWLAAREGRRAPPIQAAPGIFLQLLDRALGGFHLELLDLHFHVQDPRSDSCMGLRVGRLSIAPTAKARRRPGTATAPPALPGDDVAVPRRVEIEEARLYVNPTLTVGKEEQRRPEAAGPPEPAAAGAAAGAAEDLRVTAPPPLYVCRIGLLVARVGLPEIGAVLCAAGRRPKGQGRRLTVSGEIHGLRLELRAPQMNHFVFHLLHVFYGGEYVAWRNAVIMKHWEACRPVTPLERERYLQLDRALRAAQSGSKGSKGGSSNSTPPREQLEGQQHQQQEQPGQLERSLSVQEEALLAQEREAMEAHMSYAEIVRLRCQARGWGPRLLAILKQEDGADDERWLEREILLPHAMGIAAGEGEREDECRALALVLGRARAQHWSEHQRIREFWLERLNIENLEIVVFSATRESDGHLTAPLCFDGPEELTAHAASLSGHIRILLAADPRGIAAGEDDRIEEPGGEQGWLEIVARLRNFAFVNNNSNSAARAPSCGVAPEACYVTPFLLTGPCPPKGEGSEEGKTEEEEEEQQQEQQEHQVEWTFRLWSAGQRRESLAFHRCRLAGYLPRVLYIIRHFVRPFRPPEARFWQADANAAPLWDWYACPLRPDELTRRGWTAPGVQADMTTSASLSMEQTGEGQRGASDPSALQSHLTAAAGTGGVARLLEGWLLEYTLVLHESEVVLVANPEDAESALLLAEVTTTALVRAEADREAVSLKVGRLALLPAVVDPSHRWLHPRARPPTLLREVVEAHGGLWRARRRMLEPVRADFHYALEPSSRQEAALLLQHYSPSRRRLRRSASAPRAPPDDEGGVGTEGAAAGDGSTSASGLLASAGAAAPGAEEESGPVERQRLWSAASRIPRHISLLVKQARLVPADDSSTDAIEGPVNPGLIVRCGGDVRILLRQDEEGQALLAPVFDTAVEFVTAETSSAQGDVEVAFEVVDMVGPREEDWRLMATGTLPLAAAARASSGGVADGDEEDDEVEDEEATATSGPGAEPRQLLQRLRLQAPLRRQRGGGRQVQEVALMGLGSYEGFGCSVSVEAEYGLRLLVVTVHRLQHLLSLAEAPGEDIRPFLELGVASGGAGAGPGAEVPGHGQGKGQRARTEELAGLPEQDVEQALVFPAGGMEPLVEVALKTVEARGQERVRAWASVRLIRDGQREWVHLRDPRTGAVVCEVCVSAHWVDSGLNCGGDDAKEAENEEDDTVTASQLQQRRLSFDNALAALRRQSTAPPVQAALVHTVRVELSEVVLRGTEMDLAVLGSAIGAFGSSGPRRAAPGAGVGMLPRRLSRVSSMSVMTKEQGGDADARERWWKRTIYALFKELDQDKDGRLSAKQLEELLHRVAADLYLTRSEAARQVGRLMDCLGVEAGAGAGAGSVVAAENDPLVSWPGLREALERALFMYEYEHGGWLFASARCRDYAFWGLGEELFPGVGLLRTTSRHPLGAYLAKLNSDPALLEPFRDLCERETGLQRGQAAAPDTLHVEPGQGPGHGRAALQAMLVRTLKHYRLAREAWRLLLVPALHGLPAVRAVDRDGYEVMGAPVSVGDVVYSDVREVEVTWLPPALEAQVLTGLRTPNRERKAKGQRTVSFHLSQEAVVYVCYDQRIPARPPWLAAEGWQDTHMLVRTTAATHRVWSRVFGPGRVVLGGNEGYGKGKGREKHALECGNYLVLIGQPSFPLPGSVPMALGSQPETPAPIMPPQGWVPPTFATAAARWLLQEDSPAFWGPTLHDHLFGALNVGGARLPPLRARGGDALPAAGGKQHDEPHYQGEQHLLGSQPQAVQLVAYRWRAHCPRLALGLLDFRRLRASRLAAWSHEVTAELTVERPLEADDRGHWLAIGRGDRVEGEVHLRRLAASYFNPALAAPEHVLEPWGCRATVASPLYSAATTMRLEAAQHLNLNISPTLADVIRGVGRPSRLDARRYRASFRDAPTSARAATTRVVVVNKLGVPLLLIPRGQGCRLRQGSPSASTPTEVPASPGPFDVSQQLPDEAAGGGGDTLGPLPPAQALLEEGGRVELELRNESSAGTATAVAELIACSIDLEPEGWRTVTARLGLTGCQAYPLLPLLERRPPGTGRASPGPLPPPSPATSKAAKKKEALQRAITSSHSRPPAADLSLTNKILLVLDAREARGGSEQHAHAALVVEVRTNVRLVNLTGLSLDAKVGRAGHGVRSFLPPQGTMVLPLSIVRQQPSLSIRRLPPDVDAAALAASGDDAGPGVEDSVLLHPALFDARTHEALRRTRGLEERSMTLHHRVLGTLPDSMWTGEASSGAALDASDAAGAGRTTPPPGEGKGGKSRRAPAVDWTLVVLPPYQMLNTTPSRLEVQAFQPRQARSPQRRSSHAPSSSLGATGGAGHSGDAKSGGGGGAGSGKSSSSSSSSRRRHDPAADLFSLPMGLMPLVAPEGGRHRRGDSDDGGPFRGTLRGSMSPRSLREGERRQDDVGVSGSGHSRRSSGAASPQPSEGGGGGDEDADAVVLAPSDGYEVVFQGLLESGAHASLELVQLDRPLHVRVRLVGQRAGPWSVPLLLSTWTHLDRAAFNDDKDAAGHEGQEVAWVLADGARTSSPSSWMLPEDGYYGDLRFMRRWRWKGTRRLAVCADYWIINKTGLALTYQPVQPLMGAANAPAPSPRAVAAAAVPAERPPSALDGSTGSTTSGGEEQPSGDAAAEPPSPSRALVAAAGADGLPGADGLGPRLISDALHKSRFGHATRLPLMLSCPTKTLRAMPYAVAQEAASAPLYLSELRIEPSEKGGGGSAGKDAPLLPATVKRWRQQAAFPLFSDSDLLVTELPAPLKRAAVESPAGLVTVLRERWPDAGGEHGGDSKGVGGGGNGDVVSFSVSEDSFVYVLCCVRATDEGNSANNNSSASLSISTPAAAALPTPPPPPAWLAHEGFRVPAGCGPVLTSEPGTRYLPFRRFFSKGSTVRLGGQAGGRGAAAAPSQLEMDVSQSALLAATGASVAAAVEEGESVAGEVGLEEEDDAMSTITAGSTATAPTGGTKRRSSKSPKFSKRGAGSGPAELSLVVVACAAEPHEARQEIDVHGLEVERSLSDRLLCSRRYALLPGFGAGDPLYVDRKGPEWALAALPPELAGQPLLAVQTAYGDRRAGSSFGLQFSVRRPCQVVVCYDARARSPPQWLAQRGFEPTALAIPGPGQGQQQGQHASDEFHYKVYRRHLPAYRTLRLGGNNAHGARGAKAMYLVLLSPLPVEGEEEGAGQQPEALEAAVVVDETEGWEAGREAALSSSVSPLVGARAGAAEEDPTSLFWDDRRDGPITVLRPPFDLLGRAFSMPFNVDAVSTRGQLETPSAVLGVSVKSLPGLFHRTRAVTLWPRFVVVNKLQEPVEVLPLLKPAALEAGGRRGGALAALLPPARNRSNASEKKGLSATSSSSSRQALLGSGSGCMTGHGLNLLTPEECYGTLQPGASLVVYAFLPLRHLPGGIPLPAYLRDAGAGAASAAAGAAHPADGGGQDDPETRGTRSLCFRLHGSGDQQAVMGSQFGMSGMATATAPGGAAFSHAVPVEEVGETCVWFWRDAEGRQAGPLVSVNVAVQQSVLFVTLRDSTHTPPFSIENRSSWATLLCKQSGVPTDYLAVPPMAFHSFSWQEERQQLRQLKVAVQGYEADAGEYVLDEVGPKDVLKVGSKANTSIGKGGGAKGRRQQTGRQQQQHLRQRLYVHVSTAGRTRVIVFSDVRRATEEEGAAALRRLETMTALSGWAWSLFQGLYANMEVRIDLAGASLNLLDLDPSGRRVVELLSIQVDGLWVAKASGRDGAELAIHHVQVDDMRPHAPCPVVLQPADSGWNTPPSRARREGAGAGGGRAASSLLGPEGGIPLIRLMAEPNLQTPWSSLVHLRALELVVQELELHLDLDVVMGLVAYIGRLSSPADAAGTGAAPATPAHEDGHLHPHHHHHHHGAEAGGLQDDKALSLVRRVLRARVLVPEAARGENVGARLVYIELFHHSSLILGMELVPGAGAGLTATRRERGGGGARPVSPLSSSARAELGLDPDLDEALVSGLEIIGTGLVQLLADMARSLAQLSGLTLVFNELLVTHYFGGHAELAHTVLLSLRQQALTQSYKLLGSMDLLGNPLNLFMGFGTGVVEFFRKTQAEMVGDADSRGEGLRKLAKAVIGGPFGSLSKMTGSIAGLIEEVTGLKPGAGGAGGAGGGEDELEDTRYLGQSFSAAGKGGANANATAASAGGGAAARAGGASGGGGGGGGGGSGSGQQQRPQHLGEGLLKGGEHFLRTMKTGVKNMYDLPASGATRDGFTGFLKGVGKGFVGALAAPVVATLGGISRVTDTTYYFDAPREPKRRREPRLALENQALPLLEPVVPTLSAAAAAAEQAEGKEKEEHK